MFEIEDYFSNFFEYPAPLAQRHWKQVYEEMSVHTRGHKPKKLLDERRPYEAQEIYDYRVKTYEPITKDPVDRAITSLQRIFSKSNVNIDIDQDLAKYLGRNQFEGFDFFSYIQKKPLRRMIEDPNGVLVWWPTGKGTRQNNEQVNVKPYLILSENIKHFNDDVCAWLSDEYSEVTGSKGKEWTGEVYYVVTKEGYYRFEQYGLKSNKTFRWVLHYAHQFEFIPVIVLGGEETGSIIKRLNKEIPYLQSYFASFLPFANEAVRQFSDHQAIMVTSAFPIREMEPLPCPNHECKNGKVYLAQGEVEVCDTCNGTGTIIPTSPYGVIVRPPKTGINPEQETNPAPALRYISPDVNIVKYNGEHWEALLQRAEKALNLLFIDEAQSGTAKLIDREDKQSTLDRIGDNVFLNIIKNSIIVIDALRNMGTTTEPQITLPPTFRIKSEQELIEEMTTLREKNAPEFVISEATMDLVRRRYGSNPQMQRVAEVLAAYDTYFSYSTAQKNELTASGAMTREEFLKSIHAPRMLNQIVMQSDDFMSMEYEAITSQLDALLQPILTRERPVGPSGEDL